MTVLNQHRWRDVDQLGSLQGDAALRAELVRLTRTASDFAAGFNRPASTPVSATNGFITDFALDLEWGGKQRAVEVRVRAEHRADGWHVAAFGVDPVP